MKPKRTLKKLFAVLFALTSSLGCTKISINDAEVCGDMGKKGAACFRMLSDASRDVAKPQWDTERFGMLCTKSDNFANWKASILKLCDETKLCSFEVKQKIEAFAQKVEKSSQQLPIFKP